MNTFNCMKIQPYIDTYEELFASLKSKPVSILELGVLSGASLLMWDDYFSHSLTEIIGLDMSPPVNLEFTSRVFQYQGMQDDLELLEVLKVKHGPFDIIIDDASHRRGPTQQSFLHLKDHLKSGGYYIIEDWGTGYWAPSRGFDGEEYKPQEGQHSAGMVGLIKHLVDEVASMDWPAPFQKSSEWLSLEVRWGQAILRKK